MIIETAPMKPHELGRYVCVHYCQHSPHITIRSNGVWVRSPDPDPLNPGSHLYSSAHRDCYEARAERESAIRVDEQANGRFLVIHRNVMRERGTRTDARALAEYLEARTPIDAELFRRTAPAWNCVDHPGDGMHYMASPDSCAWCGMTQAEVTEEHRQREQETR